MGGIPSSARMRQADKSKPARSNFHEKKPPIGPDGADGKRQAGKESVPWLPDRDGPAKDKPGGKSAGKPATFAKAKTSPDRIKAMRKALGRKD